MLSQLDLERKIRCFNCHQLGFLCQCPGNQTTGRNMQFVLDEEDLPVRDSCSVEEAIQFWGRLVGAGKACKQFDIAAILQALQEDSLYETLGKQGIKSQFQLFWQQYTQHDHFQKAVIPSFPRFSFEEMVTIGQQTLDSLFAGRWYELCCVSIGLVMNSLHFCGPNPADPKSLELKKVANALNLIEAVLGSISDHGGFALIDTNRIPSLTSLVVFKTIITVDEDEPPPLVEETEEEVEK